MKFQNLVAKLFLAFSLILLSQGLIAQDLVTIESYSSYDKIHSGNEIKIAIKVNIQNTWHINSNTPTEDYLVPTKLTISSANGFKFNLIRYPIGHEVDLGFSDKPLSVYEGNIFIGALLEIPSNLKPGEYTLNFSLSYQACNDATCMPPSEANTQMKIVIVDKSVKINVINKDIFSKITLPEPKVDEPKEETTNEVDTIIKSDTLSKTDTTTSITQENETFKKLDSVTKEDLSEEDSLLNDLEKSGLFLKLVIVFLIGLALNLTPCVYPLIPITIGYFGGQSEGKTSKLFILGLLYMLGMSITYSIVGVVTSLSGGLFGSLLQNTWVILGIVLIFILLSLSMFGLYEFKLPDSWVNRAGGAKSGYFGALFMGLTMGIVAAPCIGPLVLVIITHVAVIGDPFYGFIILFSMSIGLGLPYLFLAIFSGKIKKLPRSGVWMIAVKKIFGFLMIGMALYFAGPLIPKEVNIYLLPIFGILVAIYLLFIDKNANNVKGFKIFKIFFSVFVLAVSIYALIPSESKSEWQVFKQEDFAKSFENERPVIIDSYADWCIPCKELDAQTFSEPKVLEKFKKFDLYKVDLTNSMSEETDKLIKQFEIIGVPTIIIYNKNGQEIKRITGFINAGEFLKILNDIK